MDFNQNDDFILDFLRKPICRVEAWSTSEGLASCGAEGEILEDNPQVDSKIKPNTWDRF